MFLWRKRENEDLRISSVQGHTNFVQPSLSFTGILPPRNRNTRDTKVHSQKRVKGYPISKTQQSLFLIHNKISLTEANCRLPSAQHQPAAGIDP